MWGTTSSPTTADNKIVDAGTGEGTYVTDISGLSTATTYYARAYATNSYGVAYGNERSFTTLCNGPASQATDLGFPTVNDNEVTLSWTSGGDHVIVVAKKGSAVDTDPFRGSTYSSNSDFTLGEDIGTNCIAVYTGTDETVTVTGLNESTTYYFAVYKYTDSEKCYNTTSPATGSTTTTGLCTASGGGDEFIDGVVLEDISTSNTGSNGYENFTHLSANLIAGETYTLTITNGEDYSGDDLGVWINFNDNKSFEDAGENVICIGNDGANGNYDLVIPADAALGTHTMRIRIKYTGVDCGSPCGITEYGEVEDYTVNICSSLVEITSQPESKSASEGDNVSFTVAANGDDLTYQWSLDGEDIADADEATYEILSVTSSDYGIYKVMVSGICGSELSEGAELSTYLSTVELEKLGLKVYPNPTDGKFVIESEKANSTIGVVIKAITGRTVLDKVFTGKKNEMDLSSYPKGIYFINVSFDGGSSTIKLVLK